MRRLLLSIALFGIISSGLILATRAYFSDTERSTNNQMQAGEIDLKIDNTSYYNGEFNQATSWEAADLIVPFGPSTEGNYRFFDFYDLKPSDWGEDTISIRADTNDAWGCYEVILTSNDDTTCNEPELVDDITCNEPNNNPLDGELADAVEFVFWKDDGDNVLEETEPIIDQGTINEVFPILKGTLADSLGGVLGLNGEPMTGEQTYYIGKAWCFGTLGLDPVASDQGVNPSVASGITCDGSNLNNATQTDTLTADISFSVLQARGNEGFTCEETELVCRQETVYTASVMNHDQGTLKNGNPITNTDRIDPNEANGEPDWIPGTGTNFYSLGQNTSGTEGWVILKFAGPVGNGDGVDLSIHEATNGRDTYPLESAKVEVSSNGVIWYEVGTASSEQGGDGVTYLDVDSSGLTTFQYVRLTDTTDFSPAQLAADADGFDLDAVDAVYGVCVEVEPTGLPV